MLEDPSPDTIFFLILPPQTELLPTLRSRLNILSFPDSFRENVALKYYRSTLSARLKHVQGLLQDLKDERISRIDILNFVLDLEKVVASGKQRKKQSIIDLEKAVMYLKEESPSVRVILEHLSVVL
jgi:hypothetical protein